MVHFQVLDLLLQVLVLDYDTMKLLFNNAARTELFILSQKLFNSWDKFELFLSRELLVFIEQQLELILQSLDELV